MTSDRPPIYLINQLIAAKHRELLDLIAIRDGLEKTDG